MDAEADEATKVCLHSEWELHKRKADRNYQHLRGDFALSIADPNTEVLTFDLEQSLPTPVLTTTVYLLKIRHL